MKYFGKFSRFYFVISAILILLIINSQSSYASESVTLPGFKDRDSSAKDLRDLIDNAFPSIVMIIVYDITGNESARGCGFFYDSGGRIITNASIFKNAYSAKVISQTGAYDNVSILNYDDNVDATMIRINTNKAIPLAMDFEGDIAIDDKVIAIGMSEEFTKTVSEGVVSSVKIVDESRTMIQGTTVAPLFSFPPSNCGPLLNADGNVIGLTTYSISDNPVFQNAAISFSGSSINAVSARSLLSITDQSPTPTILQPSKSRIWWQWFKHRVKSTTVTAFITLYNIGFATMLVYILIVLIFLSILQWMYHFFMKKFRNR
ncbi:MAG: serine protease [Nitrospiraceae bacterium]|nr:MAG: serine protease [Nitrospiraceae bacterium]